MPVLVLSSLPVQAKTRLYSNSGIASTACVMTLGEKASTAYGRPQAEFSQIFSCGTSVKIGLHKGKPPNPLYAQKITKCPAEIFDFFARTTHTTG